MKNFIIASIAIVTLAGCIHNPVKPENSEKEVIKQVEKKTAPPVPAPCSNFCAPKYIPKNEPYKAVMVIPLRKDPTNEEAVHFVKHSIKEGVTITSIVIKSSTDLKLHQKEAVAITQVRALAVKQKMVDNGIKSDLITVIGLGHEPEPYKCRKHDDECHSNNRNTEITIIGTTVEKFIANIA